VGFVRDPSGTRLDLGNAGSAENYAVCRPRVLVGTLRDRGHLRSLRASQGLRMMEAADRRGRDAAQCRAQLQCQSEYDFAAVTAPSGGIEAPRQNAARHCAPRFSPIANLSATADFGVL